jgi:hypothetical protein
MSCSPRIAFHPYAFASPYLIFVIPPLHALQNLALLPNPFRSESGHLLLLEMILKSLIWK